MLEHLHIRNLATIEDLALDLAPGFTVLTGETGAGKSILVDALGLVLGTRADPGLVRGGADRAEITASFRLDDAPEASRWLREQELADPDDAGTCVLRRILSAEGGRARAFINGAPAAAGTLRELGERLVEVYGQNESQGLRQADTQRELLDSFAGHAEERAKVAELAQLHRQIGAQIERIRSAGQRDPQQLDFLRHQVRELEALNLTAEELDALEAEHKRLANAGRLLQDGNAAFEQLYGGDDAIHDQLATVQSRLRGLVPLHAGFTEIDDLVASAQTLAREAADALRRLIDRLDLDPARLAEVEARMADIHALARKHRTRAEELPDRLDAMKVDLDDAERAGGRAGELEAEQARALAAWREAAGRLSAKRRACADGYARQVTAHVRELGMASARFAVRVEPANAGVRSHGDDEVTFDFSANPGQPPRPLSRVASGGELSRVSLALQVVAQEVGGAATMIFDEVDAGIGGGVAESVGRLLRLLGARRQVLCVTHLGQVAASGLQHVAVRKDVRDGQTYTAVEALEGRARVGEVARMIGGVQPTAATEAMAKEMLKSGKL